MKDLLEKLDSEFDSADGWIEIVGATWANDDLNLKLLMQINDQSGRESWEIKCSGVVEDQITSRWTERLTASTKSPLLIPYLEREIDITFSENSLPPEFLFGIICSSCIEIVGRAESVSRFINQAPTAKGISGSKYGSLGRFPEPIADRIIEALKGLTIKASPIAGQVPRRWDGKTYVSYPKLEALELGRSYVIAEKFAAKPSCQS